MPTLDAAKLRENALTSIRLGVEDFQRSQIPGDEGDPSRALSAIRNLFAGVLLLFKYKIATCADSPVDAAALIFNPPEVLPHSDGEGVLNGALSASSRTPPLMLRRLKSVFWRLTSRSIGMLSRSYRCVAIILSISILRIRLVRWLTS